MVWEQIGVPHASGIFFSTEELDYLSCYVKGNEKTRINLPKSCIEGLLVRPGFKYGLNGEYTIIV